VLPVALAAVALALLLQIVPSSWIAMEGLLAGKLMSCAASGVLHLFPFQESHGVRRALQVDIVMIPVSIGATGVSFTQQFDEALVMAAIQVAFVVLTVIEVVRRSLSPSQSIDGGGVRVCLVLTQWIGTVVFIGWRTGFGTPLWIAATLAYLSAFISYRRPLGRLPWHRAGWYGSHEDFHTFLLLGDMLLIGLTANFLWESGSVLNSKERSDRVIQFSMQVLSF
jgi:predicted membrane channel-forming protein YqfA (hemolysin III family)